MIAISDRLKTAVVVCHDVGYGPPHSFRDYLIGQGVLNVIFIGHPNQSVQNNSIKKSYFDQYAVKQIVKSLRAGEWKLPEYLLYIKDSILTFYWSLFKVKGKINLFMGAGCLNAFIGIFLKFFGKVEKVVYYSIDYIPNRFQNKTVNYFFHRVEKFCAVHSTITWNYSQPMITEREKKWKKQFKNQIVTPHGIFINKNNFLPFEEIHKTELIYMGFIHKAQGIQFVVDSLKYLKNSIKNIHLTVIGKGDAYELELKEYIKVNNLEKDVEFLGFIEDPKEMEKRLAKAALGVAIYTPEHHYIRNTDPGKIKSYLACGVPVIMTDVAPIAKEILENEAGFVIDYNPDIFIGVVTRFLNNEDQCRLYRRNAFQLAEKFDWSHIYSEALDKTF